MVDRLVRGLALAAAFGLVPVAPADAQQYDLSAQAGGDGDSNESLDDGDAIADFFSEGPSGSHTYHASATGSGGLAASGSRDGTPPFAAITLGATARLAETIKIGTAPFPTGPVTITLGIGGGTSVLAGPGLGAVRSSVQVSLDDGLCTAYHETNSASGDFESGSCPGGSAGGTSVTRTYSLAELGARGWKVNVEGQAQVSFSDATNLATSSATANGGVWVNVDGGGATYSFHGTQTALPVPEPSAGLVGLTALAALGARAWRDRAPARARCRAPALR